MGVIAVELATSCCTTHFFLGAGDIESGNLKLILGLIWTLILHYQISKAGLGFDDTKQKGGKSGGPKQLLLQWVQVNIKSVFVVYYYDLWMF